MDMQWTNSNQSRDRAYAEIKAGRLENALLLLERVLSENPKDAQAESWMGQVLVALGRRTEGALHLQRAGEILAGNPFNLSQILEVIIQLQRCGDFERALDLCTKAVQLGNREFRSHQLMAACYAQLNKHQEAVAAARRALELAPTNGMLHVFVGSLEADARNFEDARECLEAALKLKLNPLEQFRAHKEMARVLDRLKRYQEAFGHLQASGAISVSVPEYSRLEKALVPNLIKENKAGFDKDLLGRWSQTTFDDHPPPVFLIGFYRSGTTMSQEVLDTHPDVFVADEADFILAIQREIHKTDTTKATTAEKLRKIDLAGIKRLRNTYWDRVKGRYGNAHEGKIFVDKFTLNTVDVGLINCIFPDAKILFVMRDPRDVCMSCLMQLMVPTPATAHLLTWEGTANLYAQVMDWWLHVKHLLTLDCLEFRYEDAVSNFETTYRKVFEFVGAPWDPVVLDFHKHAAEKNIGTPSRTQVTQPLYSSSVARWKRYESEFKSIMPTLQPFIDYFGYGESATGEM